MKCQTVDNCRGYQNAYLKLPIYGLGRPGQIRIEELCVVKRSISQCLAQKILWQQQVGLFCIDKDAGKSCLKPHVVDVVAQDGLICNSNPVAGSIQQGLHQCQRLCQRVKVLGSFYPPLFLRSLDLHHRLFLISRHQQFNSVHRKMHGNSKMVNSLT